MSRDWTTVKTVQDDTRIGPHNWKNAKSFHWEYCRQCGIVAVNNPPTIKLYKKLCGTFWS